MNGKFWRELKSFWYQCKHGYPRQEQEILRTELWRSLMCWELKHYTWEQCFHAAGAFFRKCKVRGGDSGLTELADLLFTRAGRGTATFEDIMEGLWRLRSQSQSSPKTNTW